MKTVRNETRRSTTRWQYTGVLIAAIFLAASFLVTSCGNNRGVYAGPMVQDVGTNGATILWWHNHAESAVLTLREPEGQLRRIPAQRVGTRFEALIDSLQPSTEYQYWIECDPDGGNSPQIPGRFRTAPQPGNPFSFLVFGDSGSGKSSQYRLAAVMSRHPAALILHTGDLVYSKGKLGDYPKKFFRPYRSLLASAPFYPVLGNHDLRTDNGKPFLDTFSLPANGPPGVQAERCYWFDHGDARFVGIDSNLDTQTLANAVTPWLRSVLDTAPGTWKFVFLHHPPWAGGSRPPNAKIRDILVPAIEAGGADVVFCGHNHLYERTHPMLGGRVSPSDGVLYITSGAGGKSLYEEKHADEPYLAEYNNTKSSFTLVNITGSRLELTQISEEDMILDRIVLGKDLVRIRVAEIE